MGTILLYRVGLTAGKGAEAERVGDLVYNEDGCRMLDLLQYCCYQLLVLELYKRATFLCSTQADITGTEVRGITVEGDTHQIQQVTAVKQTMQAPRVPHWGITVS